MRLGLYNVRVVECTRLIFHQIAKLDSDESLLVDGRIDLVCVDRNRKLIRLPEVVLQKLYLEL